jgi:hypothetical protein
MLFAMSVLDDGGRFHSPLRDSPGLAPGSLLPRFTRSAPGIAHYILYSVLLSTQNMGILRILICISVTSACRHRRGIKFIGNHLTEKFVEFPGDMNACQSIIIENDTEPIGNRNMGVRNDIRCAE